MSGNEEEKVHVEPGEEGKDEEEEVDAKVFDQTNELMEESNEQFFQCVNPQNKGGHIVYTCKGLDT